MNKSLIIAAASVFAAGTLAAAQAQAQATNHCAGVNACKGQGWTQTTDVVSCTKQGGKVVQ